MLDYNTALDATHHWYSTLAVLLAVDLLLPATTLRRIAAAGVLCAVATLFTQTQGLFALIAFAIYLLWLDRLQPQSAIRTQLLVLLSPYLLITGMVLGYFALKAGPPHTATSDLVEFAPRYLSTASRSTTHLAYLRDLPTGYGLVDAASLASHPQSVHLCGMLVPYLYLFIFIKLQSIHNALPAQTSAGPSHCSISSA